MSYDDSFDIPENESLDEQRQRLYFLLGITPDGYPQDADLRQLFWDLMYNDELSYGERRDTYEYLASRLWYDYGINFEGVWDWEAFREWYDAAVS